MNHSTASFFIIALKELNLKYITNKEKGKLDHLGTELTNKQKRYNTRKHYFYDTTVKSVTDCWP